MKAQLSSTPLLRCKLNEASNHYSGNSVIRWSALWARRDPVAYRQLQRQAATLPFRLALCDLFRVHADRSTTSSRIEVDPFRHRGMECILNKPLEGTTPTNEIHVSPVQAILNPWDAITTFTHTEPTHSYLKMHRIDSNFGTSRRLARDRLDLDET